MHNRRRLPIATCVAALLVACTSTAPRPPATWDGLELQQTAESGVLYVNPAASFKEYRTVLMDPLAVEPDPKWWPSRDVTTGFIVGKHTVSSKEIQAIEDTLGPEFRRIFAKELAAGGYRIVDQAGEDTVHLSAGLTNVSTNTPNSGPRWDPDTMTLVMGLADARTGQPLVRLIDQKQGRLGTLELPNTVINSQDFTQAVQAWAERLRKILDWMNQKRP